MDQEIRRQVQNEIGYFRKVFANDFDFDGMDPIAKMMLVAVVHEWQKLRDDIKATPQKVKERYYTDFVPYEKVGAMPAITVLQPILKPRTTPSTVYVGKEASFLFKEKDSKAQLNFMPLFETMLLPYDDLALLSHCRMKSNGEELTVGTKLANSVWIGIVTNVEIDSLKGLSLLIRGTQGVMPEHIYVVPENNSANEREMEIATVREMENITMLEPFDAQQASGQFFAFLEKWKECLLNMPDAGLLYIVDDVNNRDLFKPYAFPKDFLQWLEEEKLERFEPTTLWLRLDFPKDYIVPDTFEVNINALPAVNVDVSKVTLTLASPIAKLQKQENSFFLKVIETSTASHKQGFDMRNDEIVIRDFDAKCYDNDDLYCDGLHLFNRFLDDFYAFIDYNKIKDGEILRRLRETINNLGKGVGTENDKFRYDSGTYVMRSINMGEQTTSTKVSFMTTMGAAGNIPQVGDTMEARRLVGVNKDVEILVSAMGGTDKASVDARCELLRYYALTNDRLYTRMDIDAFLRKEIMLAFGRTEYHRIFIRIAVEGAGGRRNLRRGLYITIEFKDKKNYDEARRQNFDLLMQQRITDLSCITMPIIVTLKNLEYQAV